MTACTAARHGDHTAYDVDRCRCPDARADHARYERERYFDQVTGRPRLIPAVGTKRRVEALMAIGWSTDELARRLGYTDGQAVRKFCLACWVQRRQADRVAALYDRLADCPGPSARARAAAARAGLLGPLWWDEDTIDDPTYVPPLCDMPRPRDDVDPVVVDRLVAGEPFPGPPTRAEKAAAYRRLVARGAAYADMQQLLRVNSAVMRELAAAGDAASIEAA